jgi:thymidylate kinase
MDAAAVAAQAIPNRYGVKTASAVHEARYIELFYLLNHANVPKKYEGIVAPTRNGGRADENHRANVVTSLKKAPANKGLNGLRHQLRYMVDTLRQMVPVKGQVVTFSGVDGAGKSTVIDALRTRIEKELRTPVVVLRHRPSILPILSAWRYGKAGAEQRSVSKLPRTGTNGSGWSSGLRFAYYYTDYLLGQFYVQARYVWRGYTVLYDRYYFDFINDARRSNIEVPHTISKWLYRFLVKPKQNYFLFAPAATILQRKQELDAQTIEDLTNRYLTLFADLQKADNQHAYHAICNTELPATLNQIFDNIKHETICAA